MKLTTNRLVLLSSVPSLAESVANFYQKNKNFLKPFEPLRPQEFYTAAFQQKELENNIEAANTGQLFRFWICKKEADSAIIGTVCLSNIVYKSFQSCFLGYACIQSSTAAIDSVADQLQTFSA